MSMVNESGSNVDRRIFSPAGGGVFPFLIVDQETPEDGGTGFGNLTLVIDENKRVEFPSYMLGNVHLMIEAGMKWLWENYPGEDYAQQHGTPAAVHAARPVSPETLAEVRRAEAAQRREQAPTHTVPVGRAAPPPEQTRIERQPFDDESWWPYSPGSGPTEKQLKFITALSKKANLSKFDIDSIAAQENDGMTVASISTQEASKLIDWLKGQEAQVRHGAPAGDPPPR